MSRALSAGVIVLLMALSFMLGTCTRPQASDCYEVVKTDAVRVPIPTPTLDVASTKFVIVPVYKPAKATQIDERVAEVQDTTPNDLPALKGDSVVIPVSRAIYQTDKYRAVVEGWRPKLVEMEVYNTTIRQKPPRFSVVAGVSYVYDGRRFTPAVGVTVGVPIWSK